MPEFMNNNYLPYLKNLQEIDVSMMKIINFGNAKHLLSCLPNSVERIFVNNNDMKELIELAIHINSRTCMVKCKSDMQKGFNHLQAICVPSDEKYRALVLNKNRLKYAMFDPNEFLPINLLEEFPGLAREYRVQAIYAAQEKLMALLIQSIITSRHNNWVLITQVEMGYHDSSVDDVAFLSKLARFVDKLQKDQGHRRKKTPPCL
ncbi:MAG: hypothetical protein EXX96DRAFT_537440 [Benjaminiella poitrasii]|nr:MAG: hypothetical protein EXX96DRAFT_537440 [Benjaminiella poitrasii]